MGDVDEIDGLEISTWSSQNILSRREFRKSTTKDRVHKSKVKTNKPRRAQVGAISKAQNSKRTSKSQSIGELGTLW